jgi:ferric-dicitrate binding protein FerR (iron transport regulator)
MTRRFLLHSIVFLSWYCSFTALSAAQTAIGIVAEVSGHALAELNETRRSLDFNSSVFLGDTLRTAENSRLAVVLAEKTRLRLGAKTTVTVDRFIADAGGELSLGGGALLFEAPVNSLPKGLTVESPFALIAVRGTVFFAGPINGVFGVFVKSGSLNVAAAGKTVRLKKGEGTDIVKVGDPPGPVKKWGKAKIDKAFALVQ